MVSEDVQGRVTKKVCLAYNREFTGIVMACPHDGTVLIPIAQDQLVGTKLADRYEILSVIGHGGMGVVYKARHELMDRIVAIKMLLAQLISDSQSVKRFQQEARAASRLKHPNVITLYDFGVSPQGQPYLVMDYLEGESLADVIKKEGQIGVERCIKYVSQACDALDHAHHQGVIHRDLKPGNIMLVKNEDTKDFVKVVDFGVAKLMPWAGDSESQRLTQTGEVCGSPVYMSPEQCMGQKLDSRSDIYSMGVVLYEALTGKLPLLGKTMVDTMSKHISEMPPSFNEVRPDLYIPERLEAVVFKALQKEPDDRHQTMEQLAQDLAFAIPKPGKSPSLRTAELNLAALQANKPAASQTKSVANAPAVRSKTPVVLAVVALAVVAAAGGAWFWMNNVAPHQHHLPTLPAPAHVAPAVEPHKKHEPVHPAPVATTPKRVEPAKVETPPAEVKADERPVPEKREVVEHVRPIAPLHKHTAPAAPPAAVTKAKEPAIDPFQALRNSRSY